MSTPYPFEEAAQTNDMRGEWNPWKGPAEPRWYSGMGFNDESHYLGPFGRALDAAGAGAAKGESVLGGLIHEAQQPDAAPSQGFEQSQTQAAIPELGTDVEADAKSRVQAMTPNPATTGSAVQLLHGLVSGFTEMSVGALAAGTAGAGAAVGSAEGFQRYNDLIDAGVDSDTAKKSALLTGGTAAVGAVIPAGVGSSLAAKVATGAAGNTLFGVASRYADHKILESAGYPEMAEQQKIIDGTQVLTDLILGAAFGGVAHLHSPEAVALRNAPGAREAALTTNLALKDRDTAPGIPADPQAANAHQAALESSIADLMQGRSVDVSDARVTEAKFVERTEPRAPEIEDAVRESIHESDLFGEGNKRDIEALLEGRPREEPRAEKPESVFYHGTNAEFETFKEEGQKDGEGLFHFTSDRDIADEYATTLSDAVGGEPRTIAAHLNIKDPLVIDAKGKAITDDSVGRNEAILEAKKQGKDGVIIKNVRDPVNINEDTLRKTKPTEVHIAFNDKQIKQIASRSLKEKPSFAKEGEQPGPEVAGAEQILTEKPDLQIADEQGNAVSARDALEQAHEELATTQRESLAAAQAAITCYMRRGN